jgi:hypothetical protein
MSGADDATIPLVLKLREHLRSKSSRYARVEALKPYIYKAGLSLLMGATMDGASRNHDREIDGHIMRPSVIPMVWILWRYLFLI